MNHSRFLLFAFFIVLTGAVAWAALGVMSVEVKSSPLRTSPSFLASPAATVNYGDQVEVLQQQGDWAEVSAQGGKKGWIHQSALTKKKVVFGPGGSSAQLGASSDELSLAGKGFNKDVEEKFRAGHRDADFTWVDKMEAMVVTPPEMVAFLKEGGLRTQAGGAQ